LADISKAEALLGYKPTHTLKEGIAEAIEWYRDTLK
jgi:UDP-N-acetylglucosamine 4-epimerase